MRLDGLAFMRPHLLELTTPYLLFSGKGGVGKTSLAAATALALADAGERVLLVSTDTASNLDEVLGVALRNSPQPVPSAPNLDVMNLDPEVSAEAYRVRALEKVEPEAKLRVREQLSGACTTEIAVFDEFTALLANDPQPYTRVIFDTAPTGHTLRLLSLPRAWSGFLEGNDRGASCLGPHSGLKSQEQRFHRALETLVDPKRTTVVLVTLPDTACIAEAARSAEELVKLGLTQQRLVVNGVFTASLRTDEVALAFESKGKSALEKLPASLAALPRDDVPLRGFDTVGLSSLRALFSGESPSPLEGRGSGRGAEVAPPRPLRALVDELAKSTHGLVMVMGKGGVGKTTVAAALALALLERGHPVHLSTTDPAAHLTTALAGTRDGLTVSRIDPVAETARYTREILASRGEKLDDAGRALLLEDLRSPCTEEIAVFQAFSRLISQARHGFVVLDTAPTGHSLLLIDATSAYHRQTMHSLGRDVSPLHVTTPLGRLQDASLTKVVIVTLPETTPVSQAEALQKDLRRAGIEPWAWVINRSLSATSTEDPVLAARLRNEQRQFARVEALSRRLAIIPWLAQPPVGLDALDAMTSAPPRARVSMR